MNLGTKYTQRSKTAKFNALSDLEFSKLAADKHHSIRRIIAEREDTPSQILEKLLSDSDVGVRVAVGKNKNTPPLTLKFMTKDENPHVLAAVVKNQNLSPETLGELAFYDGPANKFLKAQGRCMQGRVAKHLNTRFETLEILSQHHDEEVKRIVLKNPKTPDSIINKILSDAFSDERLSLKMLQKGYLSDHDLIEKLTHSENEYVKRQAYRILPKTPELIEKMARDRSDSIRKMAAENPLISELSLSRCLSDESYYVRCGAARNPNLTPKMIEQLSWDEHYNPRAIIAENKSTPQKTLARLSTHHSHFVRKAVAENENTPDYILKQLCADTHHMVRDALLKNKSLSTLYLRKNLKNSDQRTLSRLKNRDYPNVFQLASNPDTPIEALSELIEKQLSLEEMRIRMGPNHKEYGWTDEKLLERAPKEKLSLLGVIAGNPSLTTKLLMRVISYAFEEVHNDHQKSSYIIMSAIQHFKIDETIIVDIFDRIDLLEREAWVEGRPAWLNKLMTKRYYKIKRVIANCPVTPPNVLSVLATHNCSRIRASVAKHHNTSIDALYRLAIDDDFYVKLRIIHRDDTPKEIGKILLKDPVMGEVYTARLAGEYSQERRHLHWANITN